MTKRFFHRAFRVLSGVVIATLFFQQGLWGQYIPEPIKPFRLVNDFTGLLSEQQMFDLNNKLLNFDNETSTQIYVVTFDSLQGFDINDYGQRLGQQWGIGQKDKNNGILVLVSPMNHKMTIQTGYGLEGAVPDAICKRIIEKTMAPAFREGKYYAGLDSATNVLMSLTRGEYTADQYMKKSGDKGSVAPALIIIILLLIYFLNGLSNRNKKVYSSGRSIPWWLLMGAMGSSRNSGWGGFSSGSGSFGGFGGGGGGSFGGGGASGGW